MNRFYTNYFKWGGKVYIRGYREEQGNYVPFIDNYLLNDISLYTVDDKANSGKKALFGKRNLKEHKFKTAKEATAFIEQNKGITPVYGYPKFENIKIKELFGHSVPVPSMIKVLYFDIETYVSDDTDHGRKCVNSFPNVFVPEHEINLITSLIDDKIYVMALESVDTAWQDLELKARGYGQYKLSVQEFRTEKELLNAWVKLIQKEFPDVITGWNIETFDIPYIHSRLSKHFTEEQIGNLSPFGIVTTRNARDDFGNSVKLVNIKGVSCLDYLHVYKKFELENRPNFKLETICQIELGVGKLDYEGSFRQFYKTKFGREFTLYNIIDVIRVKELDKTCGFLDVAYEMAYESLCNFNDIVSVTRLWDNIIYSALHDKGIELPSYVDAEQQDYEGAFVKEPLTGKYEFLVTFDVASLYPSVIIQNNISPETIYEDTKLDLRPYDVTNRTEKFRAAQKFAREKDLALCSNGVLFHKHDKGIIPELLEKYAIKRATIKKELKDRQRLVEYAKSKLK